MIIDQICKRQRKIREELAMAAAIDDSCRRPGSIPFKWEICPGTPKHVRSSSASAATPPSSASPFSSSSSAAAANVVSKVAVAPRLTPPPSMSPSPYHSPRVSYYSARSAASVSPSRRRPHRPTAFLDVAPRVAPVHAYTYRAGAEDEEEKAAAAAAAVNRCFPLPVFRRRDRDGKKGGGGGSGRRSSGTSSTSSGSSFRSDGLRRSASSSSSSCLSLSSRSSGKLAEAKEVEAAAGWFY